MSEYDALFPRLIASPYIYIVCRLYIQHIPKSRITARLIGALCAVGMLIEKQNQNQSNIAGFVTIFWQGVLKLGMVYAILPPPLCPTRQQQCVNLVPIYSTDGNPLIATPENCNLPIDCNFFLQPNQAYYKSG